MTNNWQETLRSGRMKLGEQGFTHPKNQEVFITADSAAPETHKGKLRNGDTLCVGRMQKLFTGRT